MIETVAELPSAADAGAVSVAVGGTFAIVIVVASLAHAPWSSQTVSFTGWTAGPSPTVIVGLAPVAVAPPPRSQEYVSVSPAVSAAEPCSVSVDPSFAVYGPPALGTGGTFTYSVALAVRAPGSPVTVTVCAPAGVAAPVGTVTAVDPGQRRAGRPSRPETSSGRSRPAGRRSSSRVASDDVSVKLAVSPRWTVCDAGASASV